MPIDCKRFNGPEDSVSYKFYTKNFIRNYEELSKGLVNSENKRKDGRALDEVGPMYININVVSEAKGSAYVEMRDTKVICSVFDPREIPHQNEFSQLGELFCEVRYAPFACRQQRRPLAPENDEKALSVALRQALEPAVCRHMFANYQVDIFVYIIEHDGSCLAATINAAGIALANAAVPMYDVITSCTIAISEDRLFYDPTETEESIALSGRNDKNHGVITLSALTELNQVTDFTSIGSIDVACVTTVMDILNLECKKLLPKIKKCILKYVKDSLVVKKEQDMEIQKRDKIFDDSLAEWKKKLSLG